MLRIAALDDENHALERFETVVGEFDDIESCKLFDDDDDLLAWISENPLDAVFLDIEMPGKSGMQLAEELHEIKPDLSVVFVTAFSQYAVEAFELSVSDYLMKPVTKERLRKTLDRINSSRELLGRAAKQVTIHCFQRFECRIEDKVLPLNHLMKAKELLAFLVSRKGTETSWIRSPKRYGPMRIMKKRITTCISLLSGCESGFRKIISPRSLRPKETAIASRYLNSTVICMTWKTH